MRVTPAGIQVLIPADLDADSACVQAFIETGLEKLKPLEPDTSNEPLTAEDLHELATRWSERLGVEIRRVQVRAMRNKWASCSSNGILTLSTDLLELPRDLVNYVICHELVHLMVPDHGKGFRALIGCYIPNWENCERRLVLWTACSGQNKAAD